MLSHRSESGKRCLVAALLVAGCGAGREPPADVSEQGLSKAGAACTANNKCSSGLCIGGFCCGPACVTGGTCGATACANKTGACVYPSSSTSCRSASCSGGVATSAANCNGSGACPGPVTTNCSPYVCGATACKTSCTGDADCVAGGYCNGGACAMKAAAGGSCSAGSGCLSGICLGGTCCGAACTTGGTCGASACASGSGACVYPSNGTQCSGPSCNAGVAIAAASCDGAGGCPAGATTNCSPYTCDATACKTSCTASADCIAGDSCVAGVCKKLPGPGCDQFPNLISLDSNVAHCVQNCCGGEDKCWYENDCLNTGAGSAACQTCEKMVTTCIGLCRLGALECSNMVCGCAQSRCYDFACGDGQAGYCAPNCGVTSASPCGPQHPGEIMSGGTAQAVNAGYNMNMGYQFTPTAAATATRLGGLYNGTMIVRLYQNPGLFTGTVIAQVTHTSANAFSYTPIPPVALTAGTRYAVAVDLTGGSAAAYQTLVLPDNTTYGKTIVNCAAYGLSGGVPYSCSGTIYYGMGDVELAY